MVDALQILLYVLGAILLGVLIILVVKLIGTVDRVNSLADDVAKKVSTLDGFFNLVDTVTNKISGISDVVVKSVKKIINKILSKKESEELEDDKRD